MATLLAEGIWPATILNASRGEDDRGNIVVRINAKIEDGPSKGRTCTYEDKIDARSSLYVARSCQAIGWKGKSLETLKADADAWIAASGGKSSVEIRHIPIKRGKKYEDWVAAGSKGDPPIWDKVNSVGRGPKPLAEPSASNAKDADDMMRQALAVDGGAPPADASAPVADEDIPFATCSSVSLGEIAKVLR